MRGLGLALKIFLQIVVLQKNDEDWALGMCPNLLSHLGHENPRKGVMTRQFSGPNEGGLTNLCNPEG